MARREANHAENKSLQAWWERMQLQTAIWMAATARGEETPSEPGSSRDDDEEKDEDDEEGEITPSLPSPPPEGLPSHLVTSSANKRGSPLVCIR
jgi:hypothetical protein